MSLDYAFDSFDEEELILRTQMKTSQVILSIIFLALISCHVESDDKAITTELISSPLTANQSAEKVLTPKIQMAEESFDFGGSEPPLVLCFYTSYRVMHQPNYYLLIYNQNALSLLDLWPLSPTMIPPTSIPLVFEVGLKAIPLTIEPRKRTK